LSAPFGSADFVAPGFVFMSIDGIYVVPIRCRFSGLSHQLKEPIQTVRCLAAQFSIQIVAEFKLSPQL
jgi:hypothetical protein